MVKIITDSTCDIPAELIQKFGIEIVPINIIFGTETFRDRVDITPEQFYKRLVESKVFPTTAAQSPGSFAELFTALSKKTDEILVILFSSKISATYESAIQAKALVGNIANIEIIDSLQTCGALGLSVIKAAEEAQKGAKMSELIEPVKDWCSRAHSYVVFDTLEYLLKGGRIGRAQALMGGLLKITPVLTLKDGIVTPVQRTRSRAQAIDTLVNMVKGANKIEGLMIEHASTPEDFEILANKVAEYYPREKTLRSIYSPVIGAHCGPHVLCVDFVEGR
jgi:DegV family protein with EDD domain